MRVDVVLVGAFAISLGGCAGDGGAPDAGLTQLVANDGSSSEGYLAQIERSRQARLATLQAVDGWLSYGGSGWLSPGRYRIGSADDNDVVLPGVSAQLGILELDLERGARFTASSSADVRLHGEKVTTTLLLSAHAGQQGEGLQLASGQFYLVKVGKLYGWRFRDNAANARQHFAGINYFPVDTAWQIQAHWIAYPQSHSATVLTSIGTASPVNIPGEAVFWREGREYRLRALSQPDTDKLLFAFTDRTSGKDTYGGGRYLYVDRPANRRIVLDFNLAENPPCAFTRHALCLIAPPQNRLEVAINAGEKTYLSPW